MRHPSAPIAAVAAALTLCACVRPSPPEPTPLAAAARSGDVAAVRAALAAGADPNAADAGGNRWTPLLHAIHKGRRDAVSALIATGADVNRPSPHGLTPLMMAAGNGQDEVVRTLLAAGARPGAAASEILAVAVSGGAMTDIERPLLGRCNTEVVRLLVETSPGVRMPGGLRGRAALWLARFNGCGEVLTLVARS